MYPIHRILVAVKDPRARSQPAVAKAALLAHALDAELRLFHAIDEPVFLDLASAQGATLPQFTAAGSERYRQLLEALARPLRRRGIAVSTAVEWDFPLYEAVIRAADRFEADLIVAASHPSRHRLPWLLRYTDWELLRTSARPVLMVKDARPWRRPAVLAAVDPGHAFDKPAALDGEILRYGATIADALHGALHAVHAYAPLPVQAAAGTVNTERTLERQLAATRARAVQALRRVAEPLGVSRRRLYAVGRHPLDAITQTARQCGARIVAMGSISRSGLKRVFIGNTAEALIDALKCDLLIVKPPGFRHRVTRTPRGPRVLPPTNLPGVY